MKYGFYTWDASRSYIKQNSIFQKAIAHFPTYALKTQREFSKRDIQQIKNNITANFR